MTAALASFVLVAPASAQDQRPTAFLKVCKVAGGGVMVGTPFNFLLNGSVPFSVPAGAGPGGTCVFAAAGPPGTTVLVQEQIPAGYILTSVTASPGPITVSPGTPVQGPATAGGSVTLVAGMNIVTFTDVKTGYIEFCKHSQVPGTFTLNLTPSLPGTSPITIQPGTCTPAILTPAGPVTITETPVAGSYWAAYLVWTAGYWQGAAVVNGNTATINVAPGDIQGETLVFIVNQRGDPPTTGTAKLSDEEVQQLLKTLHIPPPK